MKLRVVDAKAPNVSLATIVMMAEPDTVETILIEDDTSTVTLATPLSLEEVEITRGGVPRAAV